MKTTVNLNKHRKQKASVDKKAQAVGDSVKFELTKAECKKAASVSKKSKSNLDGHKRDG